MKRSNVPAEVTKFLENGVKFDTYYKAVYFCKKMHKYAKIFGGIITVKDIYELYVEYVDCENPAFDQVFFYCSQLKRDIKLEDDKDDGWRLIFPTPYLVV